MKSRLNSEKAHYHIIEVKQSHFRPGVACCSQTLENICMIKV
jgi:hypothetical protein